MKYNYLIKPIISEKSVKLAETLNQYSFEISSEANKQNIKKIIEEKFKVKVLSVKIINIIGKKISWGRKRISGSKQNLKKAIVTLASSDSIDLFKVK